MPYPPEERDDERPRANWPLFYSGDLNRCRSDKSVLGESGARAFSFSSSGSSEVEPPPRLQRKAPKLSRNPRSLASPPGFASPPASPSTAARGRRGRSWFWKQSRPRGLRRERSLGSRQKPRGKPVERRPLLSRLRCPPESFLRLPA